MTVATGTRTVRPSSLGRHALALCLCVGMACLPSLGDKILATDGHSVPVSKITGFHDGEVIYRTPSGEQTEGSIQGILQMTIDGQGSFNQAEQLRREKKVAGAAKFYDEVIANEDRPWLIELARHRRGSPVTEVAGFLSESDPTPAIRSAGDSGAREPSRPAAGKAVGLDRPRPENTPLHAKRSPPSPQARAPVPAATALQEARELVNEVYGVDIRQARTPEEKAGLAKKLLRAAAEEHGNAPGRYVLLDTAADMAGQAGDAETAIASLDELTGSFQVDCLKLTAEALTRLANSSGANHQALLERTNRLIDEALVSDRYDVARKLAQQAVALAKMIKDVDIVKATTDRTGEVAALEGAYSEAQKALAALTNDPDNTTAHLTVGRFYCFVKGDWTTGLPHLASGSDAILKSLAEKEVANPMDAAGQVQLADGWWALALKDQGPSRQRLREHAAQLYGRVLPELTGLAKAKAQKRLEGIDWETVGAQPLAQIAAPPTPPPHTDAPRPKVKSQENAAAQPSKQLTLDLGNGVTMKLVPIAAGSFVMGSPGSEEGRRDNEGPQHTVTISKAFYMGQTEVTQLQYQAVVGSNPSSFKGGQNPVEQVSWDEAVEFCKKVSAKTGKTVRLPTEAEWEYACRAGSKTRFGYGDSDAALGEYAWYEKNSDRTTHPVGQKKPNAWGLYDMHGNVWEWCEDRFGRSYAEGDDLQEGAPRMRHVLRGGSWCCGFPRACRSAYRFTLPPGIRDGSAGLRVVVGSN